MVKPLNPAGRLRRHRTLFPVHIHVPVPVPASGSPATRPQLPWDRVRAWARARVRLGEAGVPGGRMPARKARIYGVLWRRGARLRHIVLVEVPVHAELADVEPAQLVGEVRA